MRATVDVRITDIRTTLSGPRQIEVRPVLEVSILITTIRVIDVVTKPPVDPVVTPPKKPDVIVVTVRRGDTLFKLARRYGTTVAVLQRLNKLADPNRLQVGQELLIPKN